MKRHVAALIALCACGGSGASGAPTLVGTLWKSTNGSTSNAVEWRADGTYTLQILSDASDAVSPAEDKGQTGVYSISGNMISFTPRQWTCVGPAPVFTWTYVLNGSALTLASPSGVATFSPDTAPAAAETLGCFTANGFVTSPLAPVTN